MRTRLSSVIRVETTGHRRGLGQGRVYADDLVQPAQGKKPARLRLRPCDPEAATRRHDAVPRGDEDPERGAVEERDPAQVHDEVGKAGEVRRLQAAAKQLDGCYVELTGEAHHGQAVH
jgi:hypothetical protein